MSGGLNDNHRRSLSAIFRQLDRLLRDVEAANAAARSPFSRFYADLSPAQQQVVEDYVGHLREQIQEAMRALDVALPTPDSPASWSIQTALSFARIAIQEIDPSRLKGYGPLAPEASETIRRLNGDLERTVRRLQTYLGQGLGRSVAERLDRLGTGSIDLEVLRTLERIITEHGLVEFRGSLESLLETLEARTFEIAVFGRVSSGKSSLLNAVLGLDALPVGVTPITAVPTRILWGETPSAEIRFADGRDETIPLERLADFVSENGNPDNRKRVTRAVVRVPSPNLKRPVAFVDTPGVGSLARSGARESYAYLPRCDLGILLVDAASSPGREELDLVRLLYDSAIPAMVVLSKADLVSESDRDRLAAYLRREIATALGLDLPVEPVSTVGASAPLARHWFENRILPLLDRAVELSEASARRKLASLREGVAAALRASLPQRGSERAAVDPVRVEQLALEAEGIVQDTVRRGERLAEQARTLADATLVAAAGEIVRAAAAADRRFEVSGVLARAVADTTSDVRRQVGDTLVSGREKLRALLDRMAHELQRQPPEAGELVVDLLTLPTIESPPELASVRIKFPSWAVRLPSHLEKRVHRQLSRQLEKALTRAYEAFGRRLFDWVHTTAGGLAERLAASSEPLRAEARRLREGSSGQDPERVAADLAAIDSSPAVPAASSASEGNQRN
jgi:GTP-binding protein EngB required for normal cell division